MVERAVLAERVDGPATPGRDRANRTIRPPRRLPGGRAVVGALLIAAAALATFVAYLDATAGPTRSYVVATEPIQPGTRLVSMADVSERLGTIPLDLSPEVAARAVPATAVESLVGQVIVSPLQPGDPLTRTQLVDDGGVEDAQSFSFSLPRTAAVAGALRPGERVDVLATFSSGDGAYTSFVVRGVPLLRVSSPDGGTLGDSSELTLTVAVTALRDVQALGHAVNTADVFVTRSTATPDVDDPAPGAFSATPDEVGPRPDPAATAGPATAAGPASPGVADDLTGADDRTGSGDEVGGDEVRLDEDQTGTDDEVRPDDEVERDHDGGA